MSEPVLVCPKHAISSTVIWTNVIFLAVLIFLMVDEIIGKRGGFTAGFITLANIYLRFQTKNPITMKKGDDQNEQ